MSRFITFEGIEGSGKTTQIKLAKDYLEARGFSLVATDEPGGTPLGKIIREMLLNVGPYSISPCAELLLFVAARAQHVEEVIKPALQQGKLVLCDRFLDATLAYQGWGRGLDRTFIQALHNFATTSLLPDLTILLDLPAETGLRRALERIAQRRGVCPEDRFEPIQEHDALPVDDACEPAHAGLLYAIATDLPRPVDAAGPVFELLNF